MLLFPSFIRNIGTVRYMRRTRSALKVVSLGLGAGVGIWGISFLHKNNWDISTIGITRLTRAVFCAATIVADYKWSLYGLREENLDYSQSIAKVHKRSAERLLNLACKNGGVYIKVGQYCAALEYLLPGEYTSTLSVLHSNCPESNIEDVKRVFREDLKQELSEVFVEFDEVPLGTASLAQVHVGRLKSDGRLAAVKVQHPFVKPRSSVDIRTMETLVRLAAKLFPEFHLMWLVEETKKNLPNELDFLHEGQNAERVRRLFSHLDFLKVPEIYWDYSTERVLIMEFCQGGFVNDLQYYEKNEISTEEVSRMLSRLYSEMIFMKGCVHSDPHPGNILVYNSPIQGLQLVLLDHGLYTVFHDQFRVGYARLWLSILNANLEDIKTACTDMGVGNLYGLFTCMVTARSWKAVTSGIDKTAPDATEYNLFGDTCDSFFDM